MNRTPNTNTDLLMQAIQQEGEKFLQYYRWLEEAMPSVFFEEVDHKNLMLIVHDLIAFDLQNYFSTINLKSAAIVICLESPDADLRILENYSSFGIKNYQAYISKIPAPFPGIVAPIHIATIDFTESSEPGKPYPEESKEKLRQLIKQASLEIKDEEFDSFISKLGNQFLNSLPIDRLALAFQMLHRAQTHDLCQYEVRYDDEWQQTGGASMQILLAWRHTPQYHFLFRLARVIYRHGLIMKRVNATYTDPYSKESILVMALSLHGKEGQAAWDIADIPDFLREITTVKYFDDETQIEEKLVNKGIISGSMGHLLDAMTTFIHQALVHLDIHLYTVENVEEALCRHPELTVQLCNLFKLKFDPNHHDIEQFVKKKDAFLEDLEKLDTGHEENDLRRKNVLKQGLNFIIYTLKTNFYRLNYSSLSFRLDSLYLNDIPFDRSKKFPELPYAIFFIKGMYFFGFHIRFQDLARGGLRTVYPELHEQMLVERNTVFTECYNLAWTQHKKNKDIPEGGSKGVIFLKSFDSIDFDSPILKRELEWAKVDLQEIEKRIQKFRYEQKLEILYQAQRSFVDSLMTIVNCEPDGKIRARHVMDYYKKPEYLYLGPDENMHDSMIQWIADFSQKMHYKPGRAFISSKPKGGINHKEYGVTSLGLNVYINEMLHYLGIDPTKDFFTVKMAGGPDGDVAGNQLLNFYHFYPKTAKIIALTDKTGTIRDDKGLDLEVIKDLFYRGQGICFYPPEKLSSGGFLVDKRKKRYPTAYSQETLCWRKQGFRLEEDWLTSSDVNALIRSNVHRTKTDIFVPAGGRPRTLNEKNVEEFLDDKGEPTSKAIIEGANLYLTPSARRFLEERGVLIIKDSSANKGGVICSSFEVLCGLALDEETFLIHKETLVAEILERLKECALQEARLLLKTHRQTGEFLTTLSDLISENINYYSYQILEYLNPLPLSNQVNDSLIRCFLTYCLPTLRRLFTPELLREIPDNHKKAIISCFIASHMVYEKGIAWSPSIVDILPLILSDSSENSALKTFKC